ncbi:MAG: Ig-like domain-containing protein, partial [Capnocytophaga sp.]|nr:Ig-like domain-containing protein [Capnocytophaga sp.]
MKKVIYIFVLMISLTILWQCARRGSPTGGPQDKTPPKLLSTEPKSGTTRFEQKKIRLLFDEFVITKDLRKQLIISPPMENFPTIEPTSASKKLEINIVDTLKPNTTYVLNFGNSIQDYNEGNPYTDFKYVFSTGDYVDSLSVKGIIKDAISPKPDNFVSVMLYDYNEKYHDSLIYKGRPTYITNTLDSLTSFKIDYLRDGKYVMVGLKDKNNNYRFDQKEDKIAFLDTIVTVGKDTIISYELTLFQEKLNYKAAKPSQEAENKIIFGFEGDID